MADTPVSLRYQSLTDALEKLARTVWALRLGGTHDARRLKLFDEAAADLRPVLERQDGIELAVTTYSLSFAGELVYREANRSKSLAFRLFREGIATLSLRPGLTADELATMATILSLPPDVTEQVGDDLITRLWRDPLPHVRADVRPWHAMRSLDPVNPAPSLLEAYAADALVFFEAYAAGTTTESTVISDVTSVMRQFEELTRHESAGGLQNHDGPQRGGASATPHLQTSQALEDVFALLVTAAVSEELLVPLDTLEELLVAVVRSIMSQGQAAAVARVYRQLEALDDDERIEALGRHGLVGHIRERGASAESLTKLLPANLGEDQVAMDWLPQFFAANCRDKLESFEPIFSLNLTTDALQALTHTVLATFSPPHGFWVKLMADVSAEVGTVIVEVIDTACDERSRTLLYLALAGHRNAKIRRRAIDSFPLLGPRVQAVLEESLRDRDVTVRIAAINKLALTGVPAVGIFLVDALRRSDPSPSDHSERRAILTALPILGGDRYLHLLLDQLNHFEHQLNRLSNPDGTDEFRTSLVILDAIAGIGSRRALQAIEHRTADCPAFLKNAYALASETARDLYESAVPSEPRQPPAPPRHGDELMDEVPSDPNLPDISDLLYSYVNEAASAVSETELSVDSLLEPMERSFSRDESAARHTPAGLPAVNHRLEPNDPRSGDGLNVGSGTRPTRPFVPVARAPEAGKVSTRPTRSTRPLLEAIPPPPEDSVPPGAEGAWLESLDDPHLNTEVSGMIEELMTGELTLDGDGPTPEEESP
jgi:hypothetical protein